MEFSRQEYWNGLLFPSQGNLPDPGIEPGSPAVQADSLLSEPPGLSVMPNLFSEVDVTIGSISFCSCYWFISMSIYAFSWIFSTVSRHFTVVETQIFIYTVGIGRKEILAFCSCPCSCGYTVDSEGSFHTEKHPVA